MKLNKNIFTPVVLLLLVLAFCIGFGRNVSGQSVLDLDFGLGSQLVYAIESNDEEVIKENSEVLRRRLLYFGATDISMSIEGNKVCFNFTGIEDVSNIRINMARKGAISFRNVADTYLMGREVLNPDMPLAIGQNGDTNLLYLMIEDTNTFQMQTLMLSLLEENVLVVWLDYDETMSYQKEATEDNPAFLGAAAVSDAITSSCYVTVDGSYEALFNDVCVANGGELTVRVVENHYEKIGMAETASISRLLTGLWISLALGAIYLVGKFKLTGAVSILMAIVYCVGSFTLMSYIKVILNVATYCGVLAGLLAGLIVMCNSNRLAFEQMSTGRNPASSFKLANQAILAPSIVGYGLSFVGGLVMYLFFKNDIAGFGLEAMVISGLSLVVFVGLNSVVQISLSGSGVLDKSVFYCEPTESAVDFVSVCSSKAHYGVIAAGLIGTIWFTFKCASTTVIIHGLISAAVLCVVQWLVYVLTKEKSNALIGVCSSVGAFLLFCTVSVLKVNDVATIVGLCVLVAGLVSAVSFIGLAQLTKGYQQIKAKPTSEKVRALFNQVLANYALDTFAVCVPILLVISISAIVATDAMNVVYLVCSTVAVSYCCVLLPGALWLEAVSKKCKK